MIRNLSILNWWLVVSGCRPGAWLQAITKHQAASTLFLVMFMFRRRQSRERQEQLRVRCDLQVEFDETVYGYRETPGQRAHRDRATLQVARLRRRKSAGEEQDQEGQRDQSPDQTGVGHDLQIVVVRLFDALSAGALIVTSVNELKGAQSHSEVGMIFDQPAGRAPDFAAAESFARGNFVHNFALCLRDVLDQPFRADQQRRAAERRKAQKHRRRGTQQNTGSARAKRIFRFATRNEVRDSIMARKTISAASANMPPRDAESATPAHMASAQ